MYMSLALAVLLGRGIVNAAFTANCNGSLYELSKYTCYNGFLCPVINGERTLKCGNACYLPEAYSCTGDKATPLTADQNPFGLIAIDSGLPSIDGQFINVCTSNFYVGQGTCQYCPDQIASTGVCANNTNTTLLLGGSSMDVLVPGGQLYYIDVMNQGAMGFTSAHSVSIPPGADVGDCIAMENGYFEYTKSYGWVACPTATTTSGSQVYQLYAQLPNITYSDECVGLNVITKDAERGTFGAWEYI